MGTTEEKIGKIYNCNETAQILGISPQILLRFRKRDEVRLLGITGKYFSIEQIRQIRNFLIHNR